MDYIIAGHELEFIEDGHVYLVDGIIVPSITQILKASLTDKYEHVSKEVLTRAAQRGTETHKAIENWCRTGDDDGSKEVRNFRFLQRSFGFEVLENETPVILSVRDEPVAAGRLDLVIKMAGKIGGADIKRTSSLDKEYLAYQLNMYRIAYRQCYGIEWEFLRGIQLRDDVRKFVEIPIAEELTWNLVNKYFERGES